MCLTPELLQLPDTETFSEELQRAMDDDILPYSSDDDTMDANDEDPSYDTCPEDMKLNVR